MGFNADNLFIKSNDSAAVARSVAAAYITTPWKFAISEPVEGWIQIIDSHGDIPAALARNVSEMLGTLTVWVQLYEGAGEIGWSIFDGGVESESFHSEEAEDLTGEVLAVLRDRGVPLQMRLFQEVIRQKGWFIRAGTGAAEVGSLWHGNQEQSR